ncbi:MAG: hypothetical protein AAGD00_03595 [Planctomycetota bacterium]
MNQRTHDPVVTEIAVLHGRARRSSTPVEEPNFDSIHARLAHVLGDRSHALLARKFGMSAETIRRQRETQIPSVPLLACVAHHYAVRIDWLVLGIGEATESSQQSRQLRDMPTEALIAEFARRIARLESHTNAPTPKARRSVPERPSF